MFYLDTHLDHRYIFTQCGKRWKMVDQDAIFGGENLSSIDSKGRTCIPAKFRAGFTQGFGDERFVITRSQPIPLEDGSFARGLSVYPLVVWQQIKTNILANEGGY